MQHHPDQLKLERHYTDDSARKAVDTKYHWRRMLYANRAVVLFVIGPYVRARFPCSTQGLSWQLCLAITADNAEYAIRLIMQMRWQ